MVFEEGLDKSGLPETLKEDFEKLDQLEGQYKVTSIRLEVVDMKGPLCSFCYVKDEAEEMKKMVEQYKPMTTLSKVILSDVVAFFYQLLLKVEVGSAMYKEGIRWTECMEPFGIDITYHYMVLDIYLHDHTYGFQDTYHDHLVTLVMLITFIISQKLGHTSFKKNGQLEKNMNMAKVTINSLGKQIYFINFSIS